MLRVRAVEREPLDMHDVPASDDEDAHDIRAAFVMLLRPDNRSVNLAARALGSLETAFNHRHHYPLVIFHEEDSDEVKWIGPYLQEFAPFSGIIRFEQVNFRLPVFLDESKVPEIINAYGRNFSVGYRHMCRFYAGQIFKMDSLKKYDYIWRIDDDAMYICDIPYDPFRVLQENGKKYGYAIEWHEADKEISKDLWEATVQYANYHGVELSHFNGYRNVLGSYHRCHFWNNFEILNMRFFRSDYLSYFSFIDQIGGIYYHRWGDALIRTLGVLMFADPDEVYQFTDIGYMHANSCINPCGWQPDKGLNVQCTNLPTGRDPSGICDMPERFFIDIPSETLHATKRFLWMAVVGILILSQLVSQARRQTIVGLLGRLGLWRRTRNKRELE